ncbi:hypothetical protein KXQ82_05775 [Mucilaginibacter sp. HMF5004]|uniref:hypothetical protein n=1 Tax=Mucilaginibacter rivuli TaxID=2857527 RepID=UPI001C5E4483|nr:hypothetical protein [Mucilaginibacter rivuli]MBW4889212.1 hypothetical protein [Mucilaginibacter rivuli]
MNLILILLVLILIVVTGWKVYRFFTDGRIVDTDEFFKQRTVTIFYKTGKIQIGNKSYEVNQVTGIATNTVTDRNGRNAYHVTIELDDIRNPVHKIGVHGGLKTAEQFSQRICVALRKAGGPSFK